jgi:hypothetical protein
MAQRRERLVTAALEAFADHGYAGATTTHVEPLFRCFRSLIEEGQERGIVRPGRPEPSMPAFPAVRTLADVEAIERTPLAERLGAETE